MGNSRGERGRDQRVDRVEDVAASHERPIAEEGWPHRSPLTQPGGSPKVLVSPTRKRFTPEESRALLRFAGCGLQPAVKPWSRFASLVHSLEPPRLTVRTRACAGDAGTKQDQVELDLGTGDYAGGYLETEDGTYVVLYKTDAKPTRWRAKGAVAVDTGMGCFATREAVEALEAGATGDECDEYFDRVQTICDEDSAEIVSVDGHPVFVFQLPGDGTYGVVEGVDAQGIACVAIFGTTPEDWEEGDREG